MYFILAAVLILAFRVDRPNKEYKAALAFFAFCYVLTGLFFRFSGYQFTAPIYYLIMGTGSFLLIALYQTIDVTIPILIAGLCEAGIILLNILGVIGVKWVPIHYVATVTTINYFELALLFGSWGIGDIVGGRKLYSALYRVDWSFIAARGQPLAADPEKV